ncbi:hypothetical protein DFH06DRAFT_1326873 [Mycena polygramma]|nr:hypothetical protein DFH06DRAFT_1326873 [Mycena polygramma]
MSPRLSSSLLVQVLCAIAAASGAVAVAAPLEERTFITCSGFAMDGTTLTANCGSLILHGPVSNERLDLNPCVGNNNGDLGAGSDFGGSCHNILFNGEQPTGHLDGLSAQCTSRGGIIVTSMIPSARFISADGTLQCPV